MGGWQNDFPENVECVLETAWIPLRAFQCDFYDDAFPLLIGEILGEIQKQIKTEKSQMEQLIEQLNDKANKLIKHLASSKALPLLSLVGVNKEIIEAVGQAFKNHDAVQDYIEYREAVKEFKKELGTVASQGKGGKPLS